MRDKIDSYRRVRMLLLSVSETESNRALRGLFTAPQLQRWMADLPEADAREARVDALLTHLQDKRATDGERALVLLLQELAVRTDENDSLHPELLALAQALAAYPTAPEISPYRGLLPFRAEDTDFFFGREDVVEQLLNAVQRQPPLVSLLGASGSGKSSVVFAGLLPRLKSAGGWCTLAFRPGRRPLDSLAAALVDYLDPGLPTVTRQEEIAKLADGLHNGTLSLEPFLAQLLDRAPQDMRLLFIADQFEELFTLASEESHDPFLDCWLAETYLPMTRLLTMRADFLGQALRYPLLAAALQAGDIKLAPMRPEQLQDAIEQPAGLAEATFEPGLVARILSDLEGAPGNLPLLQFALEQLWRRQSRGQMTHAAYEAIGGVEGALAQYADEVYGALSADDQHRVRHLFVQLVAPGLGTEDTRRVAERSELGDEQWALIQRLADRRLVVTGETREERVGETAEVAHEALIQHWQRLQGWMEEDRLFRSWQERVRVQLQQWQETDEDEGVLLRGAPLAEAEGWLAEREEQLSRAEQVFIETSVAYGEAEAEAREAARRRALELESHAAAEAQLATERAVVIRKFRRASYVLAGLLFAAVILVILSFRLFNSARQNLDSANIEATRATGYLQEVENRRERSTAMILRASQLAVQSLLFQDSEQDRALILATEAGDTVQLSRDKDGLYQILSLVAPLVGMQASNAGFEAVQWRGEDVSRVVDSATNGALLRALTDNGDFLGARWNADESRLLTWSSDGTVQIWDAWTGEPLLALAHEDVLGAQWSEDESQLLVAGGDNVIIYPLQVEALRDMACARATRNLTWNEWQQYFGTEPYRQTCPNLSRHPSVPDDA